MICSLMQYVSGDKVEKNEISETFSTYGGEESYIKGFGWEP